MADSDQYEWVDLDPTPLDNAVGIAEEINLRGREIQDAINDLTGDFYTKAQADSRFANIADPETITGLWTFDRDPSAPFAVTPGSAVVTNLDADLLDGNHASAFALASHTHPASEITAGTFVAGAFTFQSGLTVTGGDLLPGVAGGSDIGSATLPFGQTYIGNAAFTASDAFLNVIRTDGSGSTTTLLAGYSYLDVTAAATGAHIGFEARVKVSATTGTVDNAWSAELFQVVTGATLINVLRGLTIQSHLQAGSGTTTLYQGIRIQNPIVSAGSIGTAVAIDIDDITTAGTNFSIRTGLGDISFGGPFVAGSIATGFGNIDNGDSTIKGGTITVDPSSGNANIVLNSPTGNTAMFLRCERIGVLRWQTGPSGGSDTNDWSFFRYNNSGVFQANALNISRSTGVVNIANLGTSSDVQTDASRNLITVSDERLKVATGELTDASSMLRLLKPRYFKWEWDVGTERESIINLGFFAQELHAVIPEAAPKGIDTDGNVEWGHNVRAIVAVLVKGFQELDDQVAALEAVV